MSTTVQVIYPLYPLNDLTFLVTLKTVDPATGKVIALTTGSVTGFIAASNLPTASAADPSLTFTITHVGSGKWLVVMDAALLTAALLNTLFGSGATPYVILQLTGGFRAYIQLAYFASRQATQT
jgi:hypothetical protein